MILPRLAAGICAWAVSAAVPAFSGEAPRGETAVTCTNVASGTNWQIRIDYDKGTVDANPARISDAEISWHEPADGGNYTLDRKSEKLTVARAPRPGGSFPYLGARLEIGGLWPVYHAGL